jgi:lipoprotein-anchoring transpeptidase ErfK/SrfK
MKCKIISQAFGVVLPLIMVVVAFGPNVAGAQDALRLELSQEERELYVFVDEEIVDIYPVAIGQPTHSTPTGSFTIHQVDWNPDWTPPDSDWAEGEDYHAPGEEGNPMGRVRMIYRAPYSIHGTEDLDSLGEAESHGSIRMSNEDIKELARLVMKAGGEERTEDWFERVIGEPTEMVEVRLPDPVPLVIFE